MDPLGWVCEICAKKSRLPDRSTLSRPGTAGEAETERQCARAGIVASQQRQRLFDLLSKVSLLSDRSARGCVSAAIFAGTTQELGIALILLSAVLGAMLGGTIGFWIGDRYSEARFEEKLAVTRASGTRHSSIRFVAGELNPMPTREAPFLSAARQAEDSVMVVNGLDAAAILRGDGSFGGFAQCCGYIVPHAKLARA